MSTSFLLFMSGPGKHHRFRKERRRRGAEAGAPGEWELMSVPAPTVSLHERTVLRCFAAFFTLSPRDRRNRSTHASLQHCACSPPWPADQKTSLLGAETSRGRDVCMESKAS